MKSSKKIMLTIAAIAMVAILAIIIQGARRMAHLDHAHSSITGIAIWVEDYRGRNGHYPDTLEELRRDQQDSKSRDDLSKILDNDFGDQFGYQLLTNGYVIEIRENNSWSYKMSAIQKRFPFGNTHQ